MHKYSILTGSGQILDFSNVDVSYINIDDIAYGLAYCCRFAGQCNYIKTNTRIYYSVAEHCVRMSYLVPGELAYDALMHEAAEAFCGDVPGPLKAYCPEIRAIEKNIESKLHVKFGVKMQNRAAIKRYDAVMLATEIRDLMPNSDYAWEIPKDINPIETTIEPWPADIAASEFLKRFENLKPHEI